MRSRRWIDLPAPACQEGVRATLPRSACLLELAMNVLVVGGAGYIGSHMVKLLRAARHGVTVLDNLSTGHADVVPRAALVRGDIRNRPLLDRIFSERRYDGVFHFASCIKVGESYVRPDWYYQNNFSATLSLLDAMVAAGVQFLVFSSTAAVFGEPSYTPIDEDHPKAPINPYGRSKLMVEQALEDYDRAFGLKSICLRYFNAAGADPAGTLGERHEPETHLIPLLLQAAEGMRERVSIFGTDYPTFDGTCIRDYVHVMDLCEAHVAALCRLRATGRSERFNLGNGSGFSVRQVMSAVERVTECELDVDYGPRRAGDPAVLVADARRARTELRWVPKYGGLEAIIRHAWNFERTRRALAFAGSARGLGSGRVRPLAP